MIRAFDILLATLALGGLLPVLIPVCLILKLTGEGEIFYRQERIGFLGQRFRLFKLVTMLKNSPNMGAGTLTLANDPRVLPFGRFLRATKINELPQLINVIKGDMSLVGPRPQAASNFAAYSEADRDLITSVKPGLTGIGSLVFSDEEEILRSVSDPETFYRSEVMPYKAALERWYVNESTPSLYVKMIVATVLKVVFRKRITFQQYANFPKPSAELLSSLEVVTAPR